MTARRIIIAAALLGIPAIVLAPAPAAAQSNPAAAQRERQESFRQLLEAQRRLPRDWDQTDSQNPRRRFPGYLGPNRATGAHLQRQRDFQRLLDASRRSPRTG
jgi:hypothetical protein